MDWPLIVYAHPEVLLCLNFLSFTILLSYSESSCYHTLNPARSEYFGDLLCKVWILRLLECWDLVSCGARLQSCLQCAILIRSCMELCNAGSPHTERSIKHEWLRTASCMRTGECETSLLLSNDSNSRFRIIPAQQPAGWIWRTLVDSSLIHANSSSLAFLHHRFREGKKSQQIHQNIQK